MALLIIVAIANLHFQEELFAASDTITLIEDMGNQIPDKSWMLYLLELFNRQNIPGAQSHMLI